MTAPSRELARGLRIVIDSWVELVTAMSPADLRDEQDPPWASIANGAAGTAFTLHHIGTRFADRTALVEGQRWLRAARREATRPTGFGGGDVGRRATRTSVAYGRAGLELVGALLANSLGDRRARDRELAALAATLRRARLDEHVLGAAGGLAAALFAQAQTGDAAIADVADGLARGLLGRRPRRLRGTGFAHGAPGIQHAVLTWAQARAAPLPDQFFDELPRDSPDAIVARVSDGLGLSWCNGLAGFLLVWVKAWEVTGAPEWLARARGAGERIAADPGPSPTSLCCGTVGHSYALYALDRIDPGAGRWHDAATGLLAHAISAEPLPGGLLKGLPGVIHLAVDSLTGEKRFPLV